MRRPRLDGTGTADSAVPNSFNGSPVVLDPAGRITSLDGVALTYTRRGQLVSATKGATTVTYGLDSFYRRVSSESSVLSEFYVWEGDNVVATTNGATLVADRYFYDGVDHPLRMLRAGSATYFEIDLAGNVRRLRASGGADLGGYRYTAFGKTYAATGTTPAPSVEQPLRWKARWLDGVTGLYDVRARQWGPNIATFTATDRYEKFNGFSTLWGWPGESPIRWRDLWGWAPGDHYNTADDAARAALGDYIWLTNQLHVEFSGTIYQASGPGGSYFSYTPGETMFSPNTSSPDVPIPGGTKRAGGFHTHPGAPKEPLSSPSQKFSLADKIACSKKGGPTYLGTPSGRVLKFETSTPYSPFFDMDEAFASGQLGSNTRELEPVSPVLVNYPVTWEREVLRQYIEAQRPRAP